MTQTVNKFNLGHNVHTREQTAKMATRVKQRPMEMIMHVTTSMLDRGRLIPSGSEMLLCEALVKLNPSILLS